MFMQALRDSKEGRIIIDGKPQDPYQPLRPRRMIEMAMVPPTNGYARDLEQGKAGSVT